MSNIVLAGYARSGTTSISRLFKQFGIQSFNQRKDPGRRLNYPYEFLSSDSDRDGYIKRKSRDLISTNNGFESSWELSYYMYGLSKQCPWIDWLILIRDPKYACNSLKKFRRKKADISDLARHWNELYLNILEQSTWMESKPKWLSFEKYINGEYNSSLLKLFNIEPNQENIEIANEFLNNKVNPAGKYEIYDSALYPTVDYPNQYDSIFEISNRISRILRWSLEELC